MKKKNLFVIIMSFIMLITTACSKEKIIENEQEDNPGLNSDIVAVVDGIVSEMKEFNIAGLIQYASIEDINKEEIEKLIPKDNLFKILNDYLKKNARKIEYSIEKIEEKNNIASIKVKFKYADIENIIKETLYEYAKAQPDENSLNDEEKNKLLEEIFTKVINSSNDIYITKTIKFDLVKINGKWYLEELKNDLVNVMLSNYINAFNKLQKKLN